MKRKLLEYENNMEQFYLLLSVLVFSISFSSVIFLIGPLSPPIDLLLMVVFMGLPIGFGAFKISERTEEDVANKRSHRMLILWLLATVVSVEVPIISLKILESATPTVQYALSMAAIGSTTIVLVMSIWYEERNFSIDETDAQ